MKKFYPILLCMAGLLGMNTACDDSDEGQGQGPEKESTETAMKYVTATYVGEQNACGFFTFDFCTEPTGENEAIPANASGLHIELYSDVVAPENLLDASIAPGRYATGETPGKFTIQSGQTAEGRVTGSYYYTTDVNGNVTKLPVTEGEIYFVITDGNQAAFISDLKIDQQENKWVSCEYNGKIDVEPVYNTVFTAQTGWYWGDDDYDYPGIGQYLITLYDGEYDSQGLIEGTSISLSYYAEMAPKAWEAQIPEGVYHSSTEYQKGTILVATPEIIEEQPWSIYGYAMRQQIVNGEKTEHFAIEVVSKVEKIGDGQYVLKFNILFNNGERHLSKYVGNVRQGDEFTKTTLTQDLTMETPGFGYLEYRGPSPMWNIKGVNRWSIRLYTDGIVVHPDQYWGVELNGEGEYITIELFTDSHYTTEIPEGRYVISKEEVPYHANMGQGGWGYNFGTWYYDLGDNQAPAVSGEVNVGRNGDDYTVAFQLIDDRGNTIQSDYTGPLQYWDSYNTSGAAPAPAWLSAPSTSYEAAKAAKVTSDLEQHNGKQNEK